MGIGSGRGPELDGSGLALADELSDYLFRGGHSRGQLHNNP